MTFLIATRNAHKVVEIQTILGTAFQCQALTDFPDSPDVVEDQSTFAGNAAKKSVELAKWLCSARSTLHALPSTPPFVLADDSGLEVDALHGAPGVYSARFAALDSGPAGNTSTAANNCKLLSLLENVPLEKRTARFRCVLALTRLHHSNATTPELVAAKTSDLHIELFEGACEGLIGFEPRGHGGFGYDPLFIPQGHNQTFAELGEATKNKLSHRARALEKLKQRLAS